MGDGLSVGEVGALSVNERSKADVEALFGASEEDAQGGKKGEILWQGNWQERPQTRNASGWTMTLGNRACR